MFAGYDKTTNSIALSDESVSADWRNGLLRNIAHVLVARGKADGIIFGNWGSTQGFEEGSLAQHFYGGRNASGYLTTQINCNIVKVTDLVEDSNMRWEHDTFGSEPSAYNVITGVVTCEHGISGTMRYSADIGELIYTIANDRQF